MSYARDFTDIGYARSALLFGDDPLRAARLADLAEMAGLARTVARPIADGADRIALAGPATVVLVDGTGADPAALERLLCALDAAAPARNIRAVVSAPVELLDLAASRITAPEIELQVDPEESERLAAIALARTRTESMLRDTGRDGLPPRVRQISEEVGRIADALAALSRNAAATSGGGLKAVRDDKPAYGVPPVAKAQPSALMVRSIIRARRLRDQYFAAELFADPAWDMLLDLTAAQMEGRRVAVSSLCIAAAVPPTTALRWIKTLTEQGMLERLADPRDGRRVFIALSPPVFDAMIDYLTVVAHEAI